MSITSEKDRVSIHVRRAQRLGVLATLTLAEWKQTIADFHGLCAYCQQEPYYLLEHFFPIELAGTHVKNCLPACHACNTKKRGRMGNQLIEVFGAATYVRLQSYLATHISSQTSPLPAMHFEPFKRPKQPQKLPEYRPVIPDKAFYGVSEVVQTMQWSRMRVHDWIKRLGLVTHHFVGNRQTFLTASDFHRLQAIKADPSRAGEKP